MGRHFKDIKRITILTEVQGIHGWVVDITYKDGKAAGFTIDPGVNMLDEALRCIKLQLRSKQN